MFSRSSKYTPKHIAKINSSITIIQEYITNDPLVYEFICSITNDETIEKLDIIKKASSNIDIPQNKAEIDNINVIVIAIIEITSLVHLLSTFYDYKPGSKLKTDITFGRVNISEIINIVPTLLTNKQDIIKNLFQAYQLKNNDIVFFTRYLDIHKVFTQYDDLTNPMAVGKKIRRPLRHKRRTQRRSKRRSLRRKHRYNITK